MRYLLLLFIAGYLIWKLVQMLARGFGGRDEQRNVRNGEKGKKDPLHPYVEIKDAEFEEIKPEKDSGEEKPPKNE